MKLLANSEIFLALSIPLQRPYSANFYPENAHTKTACDTENFLEAGNDMCLAVDRYLCTVNLYA